MKFTKISETKYSSFVSKDYLMSEALNPLKAVEKLLSNDCVVDYVTIKEDVELDAKTVEGSYNVQTFIDNFEKLIVGGSDLSFEYHCHRNEIDFTITIFGNSKMVSLITYNGITDIEDLLL